MIKSGAEVPDFITGYLSLGIQDKPNFTAQSSPRIIDLVGKRQIVNLNPDAGRRSLPSKPG
jgi:hypothetical protein